MRRFLLRFSMEMTGADITRKAGSGKREAASGKREAEGAYLVRE
jgi:hypothetical protein